MENIRKKRILKVKYILLETKKDLTQLNDHELNDKVTKIRKEIHELFIKQLQVTNLEYHILAKPIFTGIQICI